MIGVCVLLEDTRGDSSLTILGYCWSVESFPLVSDVLLGFNEDYFSQHMFRVALSWRMD